MKKYFQTLGPEFLSKALAVVIGCLNPKHTSRLKAVRVHQ